VTAASQRVAAPSGRQAPGVDTLDADVVAALLTASRALVGFSARSLSDVADDHTLSEFRTLVVLESRGPLTAARVAELLDLGRLASSRMLERLNDQELVHLTADGAFALTRAGADLVTSVTERRRVLIAEVVDRMAEDERQPLVDGLLAFARAAGEPLAT
jgi:DNA-binding MarR family transcriptional regulator